MPFRRRYRRRRSAWRARARRQVFDRVGTSNCKVNSDDITFGKAGVIKQLDTRKLHSQAITNIPFGGTRATRENNVINLRGFKLEMAMSNTTRDPVCVNMAILHFRSQDPNVLTIPTGDFFRSYGDSRGTDFVASATGAPNSLEYMNQPINTDLYTILWKSKCLIPNAIINETEEPASSGIFPFAFEGQYKKSYKTIQKYIPLKRQLRYDTDSATAPTDGHLFLTVWCDRLLEGPATAGTNSVRFQCRVIRFFREGRR